jgi:hypothetical protein
LNKYESFIQDLAELYPRPVFTEGLERPHRLFHPLTIWLRRIGDVARPWTKLQNLLAGMIANGDHAAGFKGAD